MAKFQLIVSDPVSKTSKAATVEGAKAQALVGKAIGDEVDGLVVLTRTGFQCVSIFREGPRREPCFQVESVSNQMTVEKGGES